MRYYQSNAIYERLRNADNRSLSWTAANAWTLVYGDGNSNPAALALVAGRSWEPQNEIVSVVEYLGKASGIPAIKIYFDDTVSHIDFVKIKFDGSELIEISLDDLKSIFSEFGLAVTTGRATKAINDASSSAYHNWQRANLGRITVSDIDLFRFGGNGTPSEIIELKRSYIGLDRWKPFQADFPNFNLLMKLAKLSSIRMTIAYNIRHKNPFFDDASNISIFNFSEKGPDHLGIFTFEEFVASKYA